MNEGRDFFAEEIQSGTGQDFWSEEILNKPPKTTNLIQRAIAQSRKAGMPFGNFTPANAAEAKDLVKVGIRQIIPESPGLVGFGANAVDQKRGDIRLPVPNTPYGKNLEGAANTAQMLMLGKEVLPVAGRGISSIINKFRTSPIKAAKKAIETEAESLSYRAQEGIKSEAERLLEQGKQQFGEAFENFSSNMRRRDFADTLRQSIDDLSEETAEISGSDANILSRYLDKINPAARTESAGIVDQFGNDITRTIDHSDEVLSKEWVQEQARHIYNSLSTRGKAIFTHRHLERLDQTIPGLRQAKAALRPYYDIVKNIKPLRQARFKEIASGNPARISAEEVAHLRQLEQPVGTNYIDRAASLGREAQANENALQKVMKRQRNVKNAGKAVLGASSAYGVYQLLKNMGKNNG